MRTTTLIKRNPNNLARYKRFSRYKSVVYRHKSDKGYIDLDRMVMYPKACDQCGKVPNTLYSYVQWPQSFPEPLEPGNAWFCNLTCRNNYSNAE